ncbi:serine hydrolase [Rhodococcus opacus]|uniref:serine hydrolase n=1 Tax=Rhodococcus opacus TaxID=37919 RepID=UPI00294A752B|nr:serine hydrolase [Rhodococcus opacus]MDV6242682.1 serine hydrolase [Rhodococcus opacus]
MSRKLGTVAAAVAVAVSLGACSTDGTATSSDEQAAPPAVCAPLPPADITTAAGWVGYVGSHPDDITFVVDDGRGRTVEHRTGDTVPLASAIKVVHLAAYARAVASGELDPAEPVPLSEWERWYLPNTDGGAHPKALQRLGVTEPGATVPLAQMVTAMIQESDNAVPDYLRDRLGDAALADAAAQGGWDDLEVPTLLGSTIALLDPAMSRDARWDAARRYAHDDAYREQVVRMSPGDNFPAVTARVQESGVTGSAAGLASLHRAIASGDFGPGSDVARRTLEWQPAPPGLDGPGFKGGNLPGVVTEAMTDPDTTSQLSCAV